ncbi:cold-shock protein [Streptomyces tritici]|uniref:cold-shock protein n=1 Tax=Streptomyces tritici TaxID=2054410 RepID=UPI003AEFB5A6
MEDRSIGFVKSFDRRHGYGFVLPVGSQEPVFFTADDIESDPRTLSEGQQVSFVLVLGPGRFEAKHIQS